VIKVALGRFHRTNGNYDLSLLSFLESTGQANAGTLTADTDEARRENVVLKPNWSAQGRRCVLPGSKYQQLMRRATDVVQHAWHDQLRMPVVII
jgi:hypothetical protein